MRVFAYVLGAFAIGCLFGTYITLWEVRRDCNNLGAVEIQGDFFSCEYKTPNDDPLPPW